MKIRRRLARCAFACSSLVLAAAAAPAWAAETQDVQWDRYCKRQFEVAQRLDMESFRDYDAATFRAGHLPDAITIFSSGDKFVGIDAIMTALSGHFTNREAIWQWTELYRKVQGCKTAFILYETTYTIPSSNLVIHALTSVSYTWTRGKWRSVADQGTPLAAP